MHIVGTFSVTYQPKRDIFVLCFVRMSRYVYICNVICLLIRFRYERYSMIEQTTVVVSRAHAPCVQSVKIRLNARTTQMRSRRTVFVTDYLKTCSAQTLSDR